MDKLITCLITLVFSGANLAFAQPPAPPIVEPARFYHPGLLHTRDDLARMKQKVAAGEEPWLTGFNRLKADRHSSAEYRMQRPREEIGRNPGNSTQFDNDANTAYQCALLWSITGDKIYAAKSREIITAWSQSLKRITGADAVLMAGLGPFKFVNAAEILRYTDPEWTEQQSAQTASMFNEAVDPVIKDFAPFANGNWDTAALKTMLAIAIFTNDREMYERALQYYVDGAGDGRLTHYIINDAGQCQESGRDTQHSQLGMAHLGDCCEMVWNQGLNLYAYSDNRLLKGFEYTARFNLGETVPFVETLDRSGKYRHTTIAIDRNRGRLRPVYEQIYNHYANRVSVPAPWTQKAAESIRPEGGVQNADHPGYGTLLFSRRPDSGAKPVVGQAAAPSPPAGIIAEGGVNAGAANRLTWIEPIGASSYTVKRRSTPNGPFAAIANDVKVPNFVDKDAQPGKLYSYAVSAANAKGVSPDSLPTAICTGLPAPWRNADVGAVQVPGTSSFDGSVLTVEGAGKDIGGKADEFHWASLPLAGDGALIARFVPQFSSQFSKFGVMIRAGQDADSPHVALLFTNARGENFERPSWHANLIARSARGEETRIVASAPNLPAPYVTYGRMLQPYWLKLEKLGDSFVGSISPDGKAWTEVGKVQLPLRGNLLAGLAACSSLTTVTTRVMFDHLTAPGWTPQQPDSPAPARVESPDGNIAIEFQLQAGAPAYNISYRGKPVVLDSKLGFEPGFTGDFSLSGAERSEHAGEWTNKFGERRTVPDNYRQLDVDLKHASGKLLRLTFRAYNEGAALRYSIPAQDTKEFAFEAERTEFRFPPGTFGYEEHGTEGEYSRTNVADIEPWCERPLTLEFADGTFASLNEAGNHAFPRMLLSGLPGAPGALVSALGGATSNGLRGGVNDGRVKLAAGDSSPWRMLILGDSPGDLLERNYLQLNLNPPLAIADTSWIRPGKAMRDTALTTASAKAIVDLAPRLGLDYVGFDWHWYGRDDAGDATQIRVPNLDIKEVAAYAKERNVRVCVYVDGRQIKNQRDEIYALFSNWGVDAVKIGFVTVGPQRETAWLSEVISKAAEKRLVLNIHDGFRSTGINRTYPNLLTVEGIRGNEQMPTPEHNCTLPFTRYVGGIGDYTVCYLDRRIKTTHAHQLAMGVVSFSPMQWLYWYDRPAQLQNVPPEMEFWVHMPTVWDMTKVIDGKIGQYATIARQSGADWFVGTINNSEGRTLKIPLAFLAGSKKYTAHVYSDDDTVPTPTKVRVETRPVDSTTILDVELKPAGGQAIWIEAHGVATR